MTFNKDNKTIRILAALLFMLPLLTDVNAQKTEKDSIEQDTSMLYIFIDCQRGDFNYTRQRINYVNYVRDPEQADIHVFVTDEQIGDGGRMFEFSFIGRNQFSGTS
ncbi:MAG: hypothetical protein K9G70_10400, partial [Prolixibacteraceae bacterium]|nr:hypothetical protein [Prolixibacteraceae bacterium]